MVPKRIVAIGASTVYGRVDIEGGGWVAPEFLRSSKNI